MKLVKIKYFASLKEKAGRDGEEVTVTSLTYGDLYRELSRKYEFPLPSEMIQVAVNDEFSTLEEPIKDGAIVVFIPPVSGG